MAMIVCNITKKDAASEGWTTPDVVGVTTAGIPGTGATTAFVTVAGVTAHARHLANAACVAHSMVWLPQKMDFLRVCMRRRKSGRDTTRDVFLKVDVKQVR